MRPCDACLVGPVVLLVRADRLDLVVAPLPPKGCEHIHRKLASGFAIAVPRGGILAALSANVAVVVGVVFPQVSTV